MKTRLFLPTLCLSMGFTLLASGCNKRDPRLRVTDHTGHPVVNPVIADGHGSNASGLLQQSNTPERSNDFNNRGANAITGLAASTVVSPDAAAVNANAVAPTDAGTVPDGGAAGGATVLTGEGSGEGSTVTAVPSGGPVPGVEGRGQGVSGESTDTQSNLGQLFQNSACMDTNGRVPGDKDYSGSSDPNCVQPRTESTVDTDLRNEDSTSSAGR